MKKKHEKLIPPTTLLFEDIYQFETVLSLEQCVDILESIDNRHRLFKYWHQKVELLPIDEDTFQIIFNARKGDPEFGFWGIWVPTTILLWFSLEQDTMKVLEIGWRL